MYSIMIEQVTHNVYIPKHSVLSVLSILNWMSLDVVIRGRLISEKKLQATAFSVMSEIIKTINLKDL